MSEPSAGGTPSRDAERRSCLRARMRLQAVLGLAVVGAWLCYTVNAVLGL
jgi:hypothetical protein